ncbi:MAG TPA: hypothetical protein VN306_11395 [Mycobacterium sp.]|nr:hypothetical protein [Mycobacterium sp.]
MTTAMDDVLTAGDVSRMTGVPDSTLHDWAAKWERGADSPGSASLQVVIPIGDGCVLMLWNGSPRQGFER